MHVTLRARSPVRVRDALGHGTRPRIRQDGVLVGHDAETLARRGLRRMRGFGVTVRTRKFDSRRRARRVRRARIMRFRAWVSCAALAVGARACEGARASVGLGFRADVDADAPSSPRRDADRVRALPGADALTSAQYSGFLSADASTPGTRLHYWFAARESDDASDETWTDAPTVMWFNGGPGSSSVLGFLQEQGPMLINATGGLMRNPFSWTKRANLVALESPAGVGWSFCEEMKTGGDCANDDISTAADAAAAVVDFFRKFPELRRNKFYLTGESYAGVYVPTLARAILDYNDALSDATMKIPLAGIATGDPCTDNDSQRDSMDMLWYGHKYGFVTEQEFHTLWHKCKHRYTSPMSRGTWTKRTAKTSLLEVFGHVVDKGTSEDCLVAHRKFLWQTSNGFSQDWRFAWLNDLTLFGPAALAEGGEEVPGTLDYMMTQWMRRDDVRKALHVETSPAKSWPGPTDNWSYTKTWAACNEDADAETQSMIDFYRSIAPRLERTIVFNGDTDPCVSYEGTRAAIIKVGFAELEGASQRPWFFNASGVSASLLTEKPLLYGPDLATIDAGAQFAGHVVDYENNLSFVTVHGSGHMVPQFRPQAGQLLLKKLLTGDAFAPLMPTNEKLAMMNEQQFQREMEAWVIEAQSSKYIDF